ncbi:uncharacterized protein BDR25DRAFT_351521 [Lindgomyces ingoldianus]|uniref:Uncharacterized protein n=1 Tax=Lindgomyces ingoldianus TaxID=673940 RepID=A0ACB6R6W2_9PLEO|nr:uncharacterized protein BDR25DRAFT_351521 [Lindgomyces ingoldianus]KAF2475038.1 hypothetical protein BDR25DRAFT_351521 [Lindgomyces ingoldianus]
MRAAKPTYMKIGTATVQESDVEVKKSAWLSVLQLKFSALVTNITIQRYLPLLFSTVSEGAPRSAWRCVDEYHGRSSRDSTEIAKIRLISDAGRLPHSEAISLGQAFVKEFCSEEKYCEDGSAKEVQSLSLKHIYTTCIDYFFNKDRVPDRLK